MHSPGSEVYNPATLLNTGKVLVAGGLARTFTSTTILSSAELYTP